jgi:hypothetical protein
VKLFTAEYSNKDSYGTGVCTADTIEDLIETLSNRGFDFQNGQKEKIIDWSKTTDKKFYATRLTIRRGALKMTEYTSF